MMLFQLVTHQPQAVGRILQGTPVWVWGLLGALMALGLSQALAIPMYSEAEKTAVRQALLAQTLTVVGELPETQRLCTAASSRTPSLAMKSVWKTKPSSPPSA